MRAEAKSLLVQPCSMSSTGQQVKPDTYTLKPKVAVSQDFQFSIQYPRQHAFHVGITANTAISHDKGYEL